MPDRAALRHDDAVRVERGGRADDRAEVARVGDAVQGHDQRRAAGVAGEVEQVLGVRVVVGRHLQTDPLVQRALGHPVELGLADLEQRQPAVGGQLHRLGDPLVGTPGVGDDVQRRRRDLRAQRLDDRVAAEQQLRRLLGALAGAGAVGARLRLGCCLALGGVPGAVDRGWGGTPSGERDAFYRGRFLTKNDCIHHLVRGNFPLDDDHFSPATPHRILMRICANLYQSYQNLKQAEETTRFQRYPSSPSHVD